MVDAIVAQVGTPTLALVPAVIVLAVILVILVGCMIAMRMRYREVRTTTMIHTCLHIMLAASSN